MHYQIAVSITVKADSEWEARHHIQQFLAAAVTGETDDNPIEDYSVGDLEEEYP
jgi:hypothetical protein